MNFFFLVSLQLLTVAALAQRQSLTQIQSDYQRARTQHDTLATAKAAYLMGKRYGAVGDYVSSRKWFLHSLRIWEPRGPSIELNKVYVQLAGGSASVESYEEAFVYGHHALANSLKLNHPHSLMSAYSVLGGLHCQVSLRRFLTLPAWVNPSADSAVWYLQQAERIALSLNNPLEVAGIRANEGSMLVMFAPEKAIPLLTSALAIYSSEKKYNNCAIIHIDLANACMAIRQLPAARQHLLAIQQNSPVDASIKATIQYSWARWHERMGHWPLAYKHLQMADSMRQTALTINQRALVARMNTVYETNRRENLLKAQRAELALRDNKLQIQRQYTYVALGLSILTGAVGFLFYRLNQENKRISFQNAQLIQEQSHRMKNNLQTISGLLSLQSNRLTDAEAKRMLEENQLRVQTMALLNRKLYDTDQLATLGLPAVIPDLIQSILRSYGCGVVQPVYELEPIQVQADKAIPISLIINELVTNACKYAFPGHTSPTLLVRCWREKDQLRLQVQDNGLGLNVTSDSTGFGLHLVAIQVRQLRGKYTLDGTNGVRFDLSMPVK